jgi:heterodisulfide reductase subunit A2
MQVISPLVAEVDDATCDGCKACLRACRYNALTWVHGEASVWVDVWQCTGCGSCETACVPGALRLAARSSGSG